MDAGDLRLAARVLRRIYYQLGLRGETGRPTKRSKQAIALVEGDPEAAEVLAELYACRSEEEMLAGRSEALSLRWADRALELPRTQSVTLMALHLRGNARCEAGDLAGVDDLREALTDRRSVGRRDRHRDLALLPAGVGRAAGRPVGRPADESRDRGPVPAARHRRPGHVDEGRRASGCGSTPGSGTSCSSETDAPRRVGDRARRHSDRHGRRRLPGPCARPPRRRRHGRRARRASPHAGRSRDPGSAGAWRRPSRRRRGARGGRRPMPRRSPWWRSSMHATREGPSEYRELYLPELVRVLIAAGERGPRRAIVGERARCTCGAPVSRWRRAGRCSPRREAISTRRQRVPCGGRRWEAWGGRFEQAHAAAGFARSLESVGQGRRGSPRREQGRLDLRLTRHADGNRGRWVSVSGDAMPYRSSVKPAASQVSTIMRMSS